MERFVKLSLVIVLSVALMSGCGINQNDELMVCSANMTRQGDAGRNQVILDSKGYPHILSNVSGLFYVRWNGENWICVDGSVYDPKLKNNPAYICFGRDRRYDDQSFALDENDNPHIICNSGFMGEDGILYFRWDGENWVCADGSKYNPNIMVNNPAKISNFNHYTGSPSIILDSMNRPNISWVRISNKWNIFYVRWNGENWTCADGSIYSPEINDNTNPANISRNSTLSKELSLALDSFDNPNIVWIDGNQTRSVGLDEPSNENLFFLKWHDNEWICADGSKYYPDMNQKNDPVYLTKTTDGNSNPNLIIDSKNIAHISWEFGDFGRRLEDIFYVQLHDNEWVCADGSNYDTSNISNSNPANVSKSSSKSHQSSLFIDEKSNPHIIWVSTTYKHKEPNCQLKYIHWDNNSWKLADGSEYNYDDDLWSKVNICNSKGNMYFTSLAVDKSGNACIAWSNESWPMTSKYDTYFVKWDGNNWVSADDSLFIPDFLHITKDLENE